MRTDEPQELARERMACMLPGRIGMMGLATPVLRAPGCHCGQDWNEPMLPIVLFLLPARPLSDRNCKRGAPSVSGFEAPASAL